MVLKDLNFFEGIKKQEEKQKMGSFLRNGIIVLIVCAALVGGTYGWLFIQKSTAQAATALIDSGIVTLHESNSDYQALEQNKQKLNALKTYNSIIETFSANLAVYPHVDKALMDDIYSKMPEGVSITKLDYANSTFKMECAATNTSAPADFVRNLRTSGYIKDVNYNGYYADNGTVAPDAGDATTPTGAVTFTVSCILAGGDVK